MSPWSMSSVSIAATGFWSRPRLCIERHKSLAEELVENRDRVATHVAIVRVCRDPACPRRAMVFFCTVLR